MQNVDSMYSFPISCKHEKINKKYPAVGSLA